MATFRSLGGGIIATNAPRRIVTITDSYGYHPSAAGSWQSLLTTDMPEATFYNFYEGSAGFYKAGSSGHNAQGILELHANDIPYHSTITDIVFAMGINDFDQLSTNVVTALQSLFTYCKNTYPNARVFLGFAGYSQNMNLNQIEIFPTRVQTLIDACNKYNGFYISNIEYIMHDVRNMESDHVHPNATGAQYIADAVHTTLNGGTFHYKVASGSVVTTSSATYTSDNYYESIDDGIATITILNNMYDGKTFTFSGSSFVDFATVSTPIIFGTCYSTVSCFSSAANSPDVVDICKYQGNLKVAWVESGSHTLTGIQIPRYTWSVPTLLV